jgi:hypothetical protein
LSALFRFTTIDFAIRRSRCEMFGTAECTSVLRARPYPLTVNAVTLVPRAAARPSSAPAAGRYAPRAPLLDALCEIPHRQGDCDSGVVMYPSQRHEPGIAEIPASSRLGEHAGNLPAAGRRPARPAEGARGDANAEPLGACLPETGSRSRAPPRTRRSAVATQRRSRRRQERSDVAGVAVSDGAGIEAADPSGTQPRIHRPPLSILVRRNAAHAAS